MAQMSFADAAYAGKRKKTRREVFLEEMEQVVPWKALLKVIEPIYPVAGRGRRPYPLGRSRHEFIDVSRLTRAQRARISELFRPSIGE